MLGVATLLLEFDTNAGKEYTFYCKLAKEI